MTQAPAKMQDTKTGSDFAISIYLEHLEEASFLYEQRRGLFEDIEVTWQDIDDFEKRFDPQIDGLVVGGDLALNICKQQAIEGDFGELHAAERVFCRQNQKALGLEVLEQLNPEDDEKMIAASDALKYEMPDTWQNDFIQILSNEDQKLIPVIANVIAYRRLPAGKELIEALYKSDPAALPCVIHALGRLREQSARTLLPNYLQHEDEAVCSAAALSLLRMGEQRTINYCRNAIQTQTWPLLPLGLGGGRYEVSILLDKASGEEINTDCLLALGLLGDISAIDTLLSKLPVEELAGSAAISLNLITGANLIEDAFIPEEFEEDELFEEELEDFKAGKTPMHPDGEPFGIEITRTSQNHAEWQNWWKDNNSRFDPNTRYRNGKPYSPECLLENLEYEYTPHIFRRLAYEELVIRYDVDFHFETDMPVAQQKKVLLEIKQWVQSNKTRFREGAWYFAGQLL